MFKFDPLLYIVYVICILVGFYQSYRNHKNCPAKSGYKPLINIKL